MNAAEERKKLLAQIEADQKRVAELDKDALKQDRADLRKWLKDRGRTLDELVPSAGKPKAAGAKSTVKQYHHPKNPKLTMYHRGPKKEWVKEFEANGGTIDDLIEID